MIRFLKITGIVLGLLVAGVVIWLYKGDLPAAAVDAKYSNPHSKFLTMDNGTRVHYRDQGS